MCTHTTTHHTPCKCIATRTTAPCTDAHGAGYRGSFCPSFEHVQLFIDETDPAICPRHGSAGGGGGGAGGMGISRNASVQAKVKVGVVKEIVRKIDGASRQGSIAEKKVETVGQESTAKKIDEAKGQEGTAKIDTENGQHDTAKKIDNIKAHESIVEQHIEDLIDHMQRLSRTQQSTPSKAIALASTKSKAPQFAPQTPPQLNPDTKPTTSRASITNPSSIYSESDYSVHDLYAAPARLSPTPQTTPFKPIVQATTKTQTPPQTPSQCQLKNTPTPPSDRAGVYTPSIYSSSSSSHYSTSSSSDPFYISTPSSQPTTPLTPQTSFSSNFNAGIIYGGSSLLHVPIDGTKWNWDGVQWVGTRAAFATIVEEDGDEEFHFRRMRNGARAISDCGRKGSVI